MFSTRLFLAIAALCAAWLASTPARGAIISFEVTDLGANQFRYDYTVANDGAFTASIGLFDLLFDTALYDEASLTNASDPALTADWDQLFLSSAVGVPAAFDAFAIGSGIGAGNAVSAFAVQFLWLGIGQPGAQAFEIYDPGTFELLGAGTTVRKVFEEPPPTSVPEPDSWLLISIGIVAFLARRRRPVGAESA